MCTLNCPYSGDNVDAELTINIPENLPGGHYFFGIRLESSEVVYAACNILADIPSLGPLTSYSFADANKNTPTDNIFTVGGKDFILLDDSGSGKSKYFIMAKDSAGKQPFATDGLQKFNAENPNNVAYYLNKTSGLLPESFYPHIDNDHMWLTEAGYLGGDCPNDYYSQCGISLLSFNELLTHYKKIGLDDGVGRWLLRSARGADSRNDVCLTVNPQSNAASEYKMSSACSLRPVFYVDKSFFAEVRVERMGKNIAERLNPLELLLSGTYSAQELEAMGFSLPLESISAVKQNGKYKLECKFKENVSASAYLAGYKNGALTALCIADADEPDCEINIESADCFKLYLFENGSLNPLSAPVQLP